MSILIGAEKTTVADFVTESFDCSSDNTIVDFVTECFDCSSGVFSLRPTLCCVNYDVVICVLLVFAINPNANCTVVSSLPECTAESLNPLAFTPLHHTFSSLHISLSY